MIAAQISMQPSCKMNVAGSAYCLDVSLLQKEVDISLSKHCNICILEA
jgi:hypothetical protein